jgi:pantothenate kinase
MDNSFWAELSSHPLHLDQTGKVLMLDQAEVGEYYLPLAHDLLKLPWRHSRQVIAVAGPPGCGKSSFAALLNLIINTLCRREICTVIGQDGWHYPNEYLASHLIQKDDLMIPLRQIKGVPETFDIDGLLECLSRIKTQEEISFPIYSRDQHEPLPEAGQIKAEHRIILFEGIYLLLDRPGWRDIRAMVDRSIFLTAPLSTLIAGLLERHLRGGKDLQSVETHLRTVDLPDIQLVMELSTPADIRVEKADPIRITRIILP